MRKDLILTAVISAIVASTITVFAQGATTFPDVDPNAYYATPAHNMKELGIVSGYENGNFGPNDSATRGQIVTMLDRYDKALLNPPASVKSGISDLKTLICSGGLTFNIVGDDVKAAYDNVCPGPSNTTT